MLVLITTKMLDPHICIKIYQEEIDVTNFDDLALTKKTGGKVLQEQNSTIRVFYDNNSD